MLPSPHRKIEILQDLVSQFRPGVSVATDNLRMYYEHNMKKKCVGKK